MEALKKPRDDEYKLKYEGDNINASELLDEDFIEICRLSAGACFGELALIDGKPRMATIKCVTRCHFLTLNRSHYNKYLHEIEKKHKIQKVVIIQKIPILSKLTKNFVHNRLSHNLHEKDTVRGQYLFRQGELAENIFIVLEGLFLITKITEKTKEES